MPEEPSELDRAISEAEKDGRADVGDDTEIERQEFYEPRFEPLASMSCRSISEMTDGQLEAYIQRYQELVHEAEQVMETRKAKLGAARLEKGERGRPPRTARKGKIEQAVELAAARFKELGQPVGDGRRVRGTAKNLKDTPTREALSGLQDRPSAQEEPVRATSNSSLLDAYWEKKRGTQ